MPPPSRGALFNSTSRLSPASALASSSLSFPPSATSSKRQKEGDVNKTTQDERSQLEKNKEAGQHQENFIEKSLDRAGVNHQPQQLMGTGKVAGGLGSRIDEVIQTDDGVNVAPFESKCKTGDCAQVSERDLRQAEIIREVTQENMPLNAVVYVTTDGTAKTIPQIEHQVFPNAVKLEVGESSEVLQEKQRLSEAAREKLEPSPTLNEKSTSLAVDVSGKEKAQPSPSIVESPASVETSTAQTPATSLIGFLGGNSEHG